MEMLLTSAPGGEARRCLSIAAEEKGERAGERRRTSLPRARLAFLCEMDQRRRTFSDNQARRKEARAFLCIFTAAARRKPDMDFHSSIEPNQASSRTHLQAQPRRSILGPHC
ncbi:Hypothetical predicted protein [Podarcis lilfordi]|uniref:Uncharacterized protein n=1 Tax=Podarcis lilfordi TaxID=74358 RepID=A0AA35P5B6_9SAUR|nr:Hypothetical predicted protein [Podarcis lilfordi]